MTAPLPTTTALRFAAVLDAGDWDAARALLSPMCGYECRGSTTEGPDAIVASSREVGEWVAATFTDVRDASAIVATAPGWVTLELRDHMAHGAHVLDFRCRQRLAIDADGQIEVVEHIDLPGEREKADESNAACGVERPTDGS